MVDSSTVPNSTSIANLLGAQPSISQPPLPVSSGNHHRKRVFIVSFVVVLLAVLGVLLYSIGQQQTTKPRADSEFGYCPRRPVNDPIDPVECHNGTPPMPIFDLCRRDPDDPNSESRQCRHACEGSCKQKGDCFECTFRGGVMRMVCRCQAPSPTLVVKILPSPSPTTPKIPPPSPTPTPPIKLTSTPTPTKSCPLPKPVVKLQVTCPACE